MKPFLALLALLGLLAACDEYAPGVYTGEPIVEEADDDSDDSVSTYDNLGGA